MGGGGEGGGGVAPTSSTRLCRQQDQTRLGHPLPPLPSPHTPALVPFSVRAGWEMEATDHVRDPAHMVWDSANLSVQHTWYGIQQICQSNTRGREFNKLSVQHTW